MVKAKCPNCGKLIEIDENEFLTNCFFCGVPFQPQEGIDAYNNYLTSLTDNILVDTLHVEGETSNYAMLGIQALKDKNPEKCGFYADDILKINPSSQEGLLLKAYFISDNYSKEEGIRYYLLSYENSKDDEFKDLIISTFLGELKNYKLEHFTYLFENMPNPIDSKLKIFYQTCLTYLSCSYPDNVDELSSLSLGEETLKKLDIDLSSFKEKFDNSKLYVFDNYLLSLDSNNILNHFLNLNILEKKVDIYPDKNGKYRFIFYYNYEGDEKIDELTLDEKDRFINILQNEGFKEETHKGGCYIATSVYGGYSYYKVNVLRRYRDQVLSKSVLGRLFIKIYYKISPLMVKYFGNQQFFKNFFRRMLDKKVSKERLRLSDDIYHEE